MLINQDIKKASNVENLLHIVKHGNFVNFNVCYVNTLIQNTDQGPINKKNDLK